MSEGETVKEGDEFAKRIREASAQLDAMAEKWARVENRLRSPWWRRWIARLVGSPERSLVWVKEKESGNERKAG